ncbi:hypothetical protein Tco_1301928 [Tanacetum coccineum]
MANTQTPCHPDHSSLITYIQHPQPNNNFVPQPSFNTNYMPQPMQNLEDSSDPTNAMNKALALLAKAFKCCSESAISMGMECCYSSAEGKGTGNNGKGMLLIFSKQLQIAQEDKKRGSKHSEECEFMLLQIAYEETERSKSELHFRDTLIKHPYLELSPDNAPSMTHMDQLSPQPARVHSKSKSSCLSNNFEKLEENHRNSLIPKTQKHKSSECNNIKLAVEMPTSEVVCANVYSQWFVTAIKMSLKSMACNQMSDCNPFFKEKGSVRFSALYLKKKRNLLVFTSVDMIVMTSMVELESLFGHLFDELSKEENHVVSKSFAVTTTDAFDKRQQQQDSTSSTSTLATIYTELLQRFARLEKHSISLEIAFTRMSSTTKN